MTDSLTDQPTSDGQTGSKENILASKKNNKRKRSQTDFEIWTVRQVMMYICTGLIVRDGVT